MLDVKASLLHRVVATHQFLQAGLLGHQHNIVEELVRCGAKFHYNAEIVDVEQEGQKISTVIDRQGRVALSYF